MFPQSFSPTLLEMARITAAVAITVSLILLPSAAGSAATSHVQVMLGNKNLLSHGIGWGTVHPRLIFNGGDPSGRAWNLRWSGWGSAVAHARGDTWISAPQGGYYKKPGAIEFRAYGLGRCSPTGPRAYTHLQARVALRHGGHLGRWLAWGGWRSICRFP